VPALLHGLMRLATLRWLGALLCALAMMLGAASNASALESQQTKTRVWDFELAGNNSYGLLDAATSRKHQGNRLAQSELWSGCLLARFDRAGRLIGFLEP
jgi:hypothetical protein